MNEETVRQALKQLPRPDELDGLVAITARNITEVSVNELPDGGYNVNVYFNMGNDYWDETDFVKRSAASAEVVFQRLFENPAVARVTVWSETQFKDPYGKTSTDTGTRLSMDRDTASKVDWNGLATLELEDWHHIYDIATQYYIHPAIYKNLSDPGDLSVSGGTGQ
ncbi:MAG: hypothetical protein QJR03_15000 [Sphaerobacter sp.]|nr:hypothetical protein [Sphaerobacter sp.]